MNKKLLERLILVEDNLRDIESDLIRINTKYPYEPALLYKLGLELDILHSVIDYLKQENLK